MRNLLKVTILAAVLGLVLGGCNIEPSPTVTGQPASPMGGAPLSPRPQLGYPAPDFELTDLDGKPASLGDFLGKPVFIDFWSST